MNLMIVDDSPVVRQMVVALAQEIDGLEVAWQAGSVHDALQLLLQADPDVVLLDIQLQDGYGIEVLRAIRAQRPGLAVIVFTHYDGLFRTAYLAAGARRVLSKTGSLEALKAALQELVDEDRQIYEYARALGIKVGNRRGERGK